jgi:hypothetical protein
MKQKNLKGTALFTLDFVGPNGPSLSAETSTLFFVATILMSRGDPVTLFTMFLCQPQPRIPSIHKVVDRFTKSTLHNNQAYNLRNQSKWCNTLLTYEHTPCLMLVSLSRNTN